MSEEQKDPNANINPSSPPKYRRPAPQPVAAQVAASESDFADDEDPTILSEETKEQIRQEVRKKLAIERRKSAMQLFRDQEERRLRMEEGMVVGGVQDQMVTITLDLAKHSACLLVNLQPYWHGHTYTVPRHVANSLAEQQFRGWQHQYEIDGKTRFDFYADHRNTVISPVKGVKRAPQRAALPGQG